MTLRMCMQTHNPPPPTHTPSRGAGSAVCTIRSPPHSLHPSSFPHRRHTQVPNLSRAECAQLGKAYADAAVGLDVVLLGPEADLSDGDREALEALTARTMYSASSSSSSGTSGGRAAGPGPSSSAGGRGSALQQPAAAHAQPGGQQLVLMPPPSDPSQQLWRQLEPLLEALQLEADPDSEVRVAARCCALLLLLCPRSGWWAQHRHTAAHCASPLRCMRSG